MNLNPALEEKIDAAKALLLDIGKDFSPAAFANSFGAEDMVLTDLICLHAADIVIFTLDTGLLLFQRFFILKKVH